MGFRHLARWVVLAAALGCTSRLPAPDVARQPAKAFVVVPYPPPAARVEVVPERPRDDARWVDGQWTWDGEVWTWSAGAWVLVPSGVAFAPCEVQVAEDGRVLFAPASWRDAAGHEVAAPTVLVAAGDPADRVRAATPAPDGGEP